MQNPRDVQGIGPTRQSKNCDMPWSTHGHWITRPPLEI